MTFTLKYGRGKGVREQKITNPSPEMIEQTIKELLPGLDYYIVFQSEPPVNNYAYIQTAIERWDDKPEIKYMVEVNVKSDENFTQYRKYIKDENEVKRLFRMFALEKTPDVTDWKDVTEEIKNLPDLETQRKNAKR